MRSLNSNLRFCIYISEILRFKRKSYISGIYSQDSGHRSLKLYPKVVKESEIIFRHYTVLTQTKELNKSDEPFLICLNIFQFLLIVERQTIKKLQKMTMLDFLFKISGYSINPEPDLSTLWRYGQVYGHNIKLIRFKQIWDQIKRESQ